jgi:hypothetical protein
MEIQLRAGAMCGDAARDVHPPIVASAPVERK